MIADYESGRAIPNNQVLGKIERAIGECPSTFAGSAGQGGHHSWLGLVRVGLGRRRWP